MKTIGKYILNGHEVVPETDLIKWATWIENSRDECLVEKTVLEGKDESMFISTRFMGIELEHSPGTKPKVFETAVFGGYPNAPVEIAIQRYYTWEEAEAGHKDTVEFTKNQMAEFPI